MTTKKKLAVGNRKPSLFQFVFLVNLIYHLSSEYEFIWDRNMSKSFDAIIVGSGPVGSIASLLLAERNFNVAIVEKNKHPYPHPRAVGLNGYSLSLIEILLGKLWKDFKFTSAIEVGYMLDKNKMSKPF